MLFYKGKRATDNSSHQCTQAQANYTVNDGSDNLLLMMSTSHFKRKPTGYQAGVLRKECVKNGPLLLSVSQFCKNVAQGYAFVPACLNGTTSDDFLGQQIFCLDFDNLTELESGTYKEVGVNIALIDYAIKRGLKVICCYPTYSYTSVNPKCRLVIDNQEFIQDVGERNKTMFALLNAFRLFKPDTSCKDSARVFFGTNNEVIQLCQI